MWPGTDITRFIKFGVVGCGGFIVDSSFILAATMILGLGPYGGRFFSFLIAATFTWYANRRFTYPDRRSSSLFREWIRFLTANTAGAALNFLTYMFGVYLFGSTSTILVLAVAAGSIAGMLLNFALSHRFVFRS